jgi:hypothetical protein
MERENEMDEKKKIKIIHIYPQQKPRKPRNQEQCQKTEFPGLKVYARQVLVAMSGDAQHA